ncbi:MAG: CDP-alcohol phosphatidyltransferase family protein [Flavobacteriales bacterium]|nr:CDP-alcohol phosphatidyltransferase family protein [Flavobacteriales bacterium]
MKNQIPNAISILSLILSCLAIVLIFENKLDIAAYLLIGSCVCDFFDGFAARALKVNNPIGKEIDSLVDMVAFGVAPGMLLYKFTVLLQEEHPVQIITDYPWLLYLAVLIPILSSIRLAKFNIDTRQTTSFIGLAVPAHAAFYIFVVIIYFHPDLPKIIDVNSFIMPIISNPLIMLTSGILLSFMLIAEVPMFSLKVKNLKWSENKLPLTFLFIWLALLSLTNIVAMPTIILIYIGWSIIANFKNKSLTT